MSVVRMKYIREIVLLMLTTLLYPVSTIENWSLHLSHAPVTTPVFPSAAPEVPVAEFLEGQIVVPHVFSHIFGLPSPMSLFGEAIDASNFGDGSPRLPSIAPPGRPRVGMVATVLGLPLATLQAQLTAQIFAFQSQEGGALDSSLARTAARRTGLAASSIEIVSAVDDGIGIPDVPGRAGPGFAIRWSASAPTSTQLRTEVGLSSAPNARSHEHQHKVPHPRADYVGNIGDSGFISVQGSVKSGRDGAHAELLGPLACTAAGTDALSHIGLVAAGRKSTDKVLSGMRTSTACPLYVFSDAEAAWDAGVRPADLLIRPGYSPGMLQLLSECAAMIIAAQRIASATVTSIDRPALQPIAEDEVGLLLLRAHLSGCDAVDREFGVDSHESVAGRLSMARALAFADGQLFASVRSSTDQSAASVPQTYVGSIFARSPLPSRGSTVADDDIV